MLQPRSRRGPIVTAVVLVALLVGLAPIGPTARMIATAQAAQDPGLSFPTKMKVDTDARQIQLGDLDNDGDLDIVAIDDFYGVGTYRNDVVDGARIYTETGPSATRNLRGNDYFRNADLALGDLNRDGLLDIVAVSDYMSAIYINEGAGAFPTRDTTTIGSGAATVALGDLNGDGWLDIVLGRFNGQNAVHLNNGSGGFGVAQPFGPASSRTREIALANIDGANGLDILAANGLDCDYYYSCNNATSGQSLVYINNGSGAFPTNVTFGPSDAQHVTLTTGDFDNDGDSDIAVTNWFAVAQIFYNTSGTFGTSYSLTSVTQLQRGIAAGDIDADGDADLIFGSVLDRHVTLINPGVAGPSPLEVSPNLNAAAEQLQGLAIGDLNGDGDLDIVGSSAAAGLEVHYSGQSSAFSAAVAFGPSSTSFEIERDVQLGDMNKDGRLDIVVALEGKAVLYLNTGAGGGATPTFAAASAFENEAGKTNRVVLGDVDGDNDLDAIVAKVNAPRLLFRNNGSGTLTLAGPIGSAAEPTSPFNGSFNFPEGGDLLLADVDGDGDLDLITARETTDGLRIFANNGSGAFTQRAALNYSVVAVIGGDLDGDGDFDLIAKQRQAMHFFANNGTGSFAEVQIGNTLNTFLGAPFELGDLDGDGDLDLLSVDRFGDMAVLPNNGQGVFGQPRTASVGVGRESLGDVDGDGDLDIVGWGPRAMIAMNDGTGAISGSRKALAPGELTIEPAASALGDMNGDGSLDLVTLSYNRGGAVSLNRLRQGNGLGNGAPRVQVRRPGLGAEANFLSSPEILTSRNIAISYRLSDPEGDQVRRVRAEFSPDGGGRWLPAVPAAGTVTTNLAAPVGGADYTFTWDTFASGLFGNYNQLVFRLIAEPTVLPRTSAPSGPFQHAAVSTTSYPFRVRGGQVRVLRNSAAAPNAIVYRIPSGQSSGAAISRTDGTPYHTDVAGYLQGRGGLAIGDKLIALLPISTDEKYTRYLTSAAVGASGPSMFSVAQPGVQTLTIGQANPLLAISLTVSLEWDARKDTLFLNQLKADLRRSSELLYIWSDGQIALGKITIYHNKENWTTADVQIGASNGLRPNANQGGIVRADRTDPDKPSLTYEPGQIRMGAVWTRFGDATGQDGEDWPRSFAHELGHWALFLDEDYLGFDANKRLVTVEGCASPMADPYRNDYGQFRGETPAVCQPTLNQQISGRSNWDTIKTFYDDAGLNWRLNKPASFAPSSGPSFLPFAITTISEVLPSSSTDPLLAVPIFSMQTAGGTRYLATGGAKAVLFSADGTRITDLGLPERGEVNARGARVGDRLCVFDIDNETSGCTTVAAGATQLTMAAQPGWQPELLVTPSSPTSYAISVARLPAGLSLKARLYSSEGSPSPVVTLTRSGAVYSGTANPGGPILSGYLHVWEDSGARREAVTDYALGGNPAPPAKPPKRKGRNAPALSPDGQVVLFSDNLTFNDGAYFAIQSLTSLPLAAPAWTVPVGFGYRLLASANAPSLTGTSLNMSYLESDVVPGTEGGIGMYYLPDGGSAWQRLTTRLDPRVNEVSAAALGPGTYVLMSSAGLRAGWNLLSYPWPTPTLTITDGMQLVGGTGNFTTVYGYDPSDTADPWEVYDTGVPAFVNDLSQLRYGRGYWVRASTGAAAVVADDATLAQAISPERPATLYGTVASGTAGRPVEARIGSTVCATTTTRSAGGSIVFVFDVPAAGERAGCGVGGAVVTVRVNGAPFGATTWEAERPKEVRLGDTANRSIYLPLIRR